jgi:hypothetical protein
VPVTITLSQFIRFESASGNRRIRVVEEVRTQGDWDKLKDFNLPLRQKIRSLISDGDLSGANLRAFADEVEDDKKRSRYRKHAAGYRDFERRQRPAQAGTVQRALWSDGALRVTLDPEVIFRIGERRFLTKFYLRKDVLEPSSLIASLQMLKESYPRGGYQVAILDCECGLIHRDTRLNRDSVILLRTTAAQFVGIWRLLEEGFRPSRINEIS